MLYPTAIHAFVDIGTSEYPGEGAEPVLSAKDLSEAHQLVASVNQPKGWVTRYTSNVLDLSHEEATFNLDSLQEFQNTEFEDAIGLYHNNNATTQQFGGQAEGELGSHDRDFEIQQSWLAMKALSLRDDARDSKIQSLFQIIPQPYHHGCISPPRPPNEIGNSVKNWLVYQYIHPVMLHIFPHTIDNPTGKISEELAYYDEAANLFIKTWPRRTITWIIPIQGTLPWSNTSEGQLVPAEMYINPNLLQKHRRLPEPIIWTAPLLQEFWSYILHHHQESTFGPLTLTFDPSFSSQQERKGVPNGPMRRPVILISCYGAMAMKLRMLITCFHLKPPSDTLPPPSNRSAGTSGMSDRNIELREHIRWEDMLIAPLRRARLPMLDEDGAPLLIS